MIMRRIKHRQDFCEDIVIDYPQNIRASSSAYTSMMDFQPDNTTSNKQIYEENIVEESIGANNNLSACDEIAPPTLENILASSDSTSSMDSKPDDNTTIMQIYQGNAVDESIGIKNKLSTSARIAFLRGELSTLDLKRSFSLFGRLIKGINLESCPHDEHLKLFFKFADLLSFKMFLRKEYNWPRCSSTNKPRCRIECFAFDDQKNFITSIGLLTRQLKMLIVLYPNVVHNMQYINDAFALTAMPRTLTICLKSLLPKIMYNFLAELTYEWVQEPCPVLKIARQLELEERRDQQEHQSLIELIENC
ncbi:uncharacterized protein [Drosophila tropicalis]|uniref:uncharacterized protein n=1 Tax=Drosophila tropicalis TaxID=46794 RepID=UPI0035AB9825